MTKPDSWRWASRSTHWFADRRCLRSRFSTSPLSLLIFATIALFHAVPAFPSELTALYDNERSGWDRNEPSLTPALLKSGHFGKLFDTPIDGQAYAQPLVVGSDVIVATEANIVYAIDTASGVVRWETALARPAPSDCYAASPQLGILSTPVIDAGTGTIYAVARVCDGLATDCITPIPKPPRLLDRMLQRVYKWAGWPSGAHYLMYAVRASDGHQLDGWPVEIAGRASNDSNAIFSARMELQRPALILIDGFVYAAFGGLCGGYPFRGWIAGVNIKTHRVTFWTDEAATQERSPQAGIWAIGGLVSDGPRTILLATGDGILPPRGDGKVQVNTLGNSVVRLTIQEDGSLVAADHFTPSDAQYLNDSDNDIGTASPVVLPDVFSSRDHPHLLLQVSKTGKLYLLDRTNLGGEKFGPDGVDASLAETGPFGPIFAHPAAWTGNGGYFYVLSYEQKPDDKGPGLRAFSLGRDRLGALVFRLAGTNQAPFQWYTGSPIITSNGTASDSAIIWIIVRHSHSDELQAYSAVPDPDTHLTMLWHTPIGSRAAAKFAMAATDSGRVFVATADGRLLAFGRK
jgi:hypothetical protein